MSIKATAVVQITIEVISQSPWGDECTVAQVHKQAGREARDQVCNLIGASGKNNMRLVGEPTVTAVLAANS